MNTTTYVYFSSEKKNAISGAVHSSLRSCVIFDVFLFSRMLKSTSS